MSRPKLLGPSLVLLLVSGTQTMGVAQDFVPGGWSAEVVHHSLGPLTTFSPSYGTGQVAYSPYGVYHPSLTTSQSFPNYVQAPGTANGLLPLGDVIRKSKAPKAKRSR